MCDIGMNIKKYRRQAGFSQEKLALLSGLSTMSIRRYESNDRKPNIEQLRKISSALGILTGKLLGEDYGKYTGETAEGFSRSDHISDYKPAAKGAGLYAGKTADSHVQSGYTGKRGFLIKDITMNLDKLNEKGLRRVSELTRDLLLIKNYLVEVEGEVETDKSFLEPNAAHERTDIEVTDEMRKADDDIMDDDNF